MRRPRSMSPLTRAGQSRNDVNVQERNLRASQWPVKVKMGKEGPEIEDNEVLLRKYPWDDEGTL